MEKAVKEDIDIKCIQEIETDILAAFHRFCQAHDLRYYLGGGTLLGAIRHKGFIPWDDDMDVLMPRSDYMKFLELTKDSGRIEENYRIVSIYHNSELPVTGSTTRIYDDRTECIFDDMRLRFPIGCWIDIFAMDGMSDNVGVRKRTGRQMRFLLDMLYFCETKFGVKRRSQLITILQYPCFPIMLIARAIGHKAFIRRMEKICLKLDYEKSEWVGVIAGRAGEKEAMRKEKLEPAILVDFDGYKFYAMANYDEYLTNLYGDYMTPPSESERISRHNISVYWKTKEDLK